MRRPSDGSREQKTAHDPGVAAIEDLFRRCERRIGRFLVQMVNDRGLAEDLLQDTFHDAFRDRPQLQHAPSPEGWLFAIARNRALNALRRQRRSILAVGRLTQRARRSQREPPDVVALNDLLKRHLAPEERALLLLRYLHGFDSSELAEMVGSTPEAVRQRLSRLRRRLLLASAEPPPVHSTEEGR